VHLRGVECGEEQEKAERHDENVGRIARHAQCAQAFATPAVAALAVDIIRVRLPQQRHGQLRAVFSDAFGHESAVAAACAARM